LNCFHSNNTCAVLSWRRSAHLISAWCSAMIYI